MTAGDRARPAPRFSWHDTLLVLWLALIGADRIDLLGGKGPFQLTPYLALTPFVLASEVLRAHRHAHRIRLPRSGASFLLLALTLLVVVGLSVFVSPELSKSAARAALLAAHLAGAFAVIVAAADREHMDRVFERGAVVGLLLFAALDALQLANLVGIVPDMARLGTASIDLVPSTYGEIVPRLSGTVADQNRSGLILLFYGWFVGYRPGRGPRTGLLALAFVLSVLTLSRSAAVAGLVTFAVLVLDRRVRTVSLGLVFAATLLLSIGMGALLTSPRARDWAGTTLAPLGQRLSVDEGSSQEHFMLIGRGLSEATTSLQRLALGIGYGSAYTVLQDVFPGNRYASFHSLYVTIFAESGIVALVCVLLMFAVPLVRGGPYRALVAGAAVFNLFYQAHTDPALWIILILAWLTLERGAEGIAARHHRVVRPVGVVEARVAGGGAERTDSETATSGTVGEMRSPSTKLVPRPGVTT